MTSITLIRAGGCTCRHFPRSGARTAIAHRKPGGRAWHRLYDGAAASRPRARHALMMLEPSPVEPGTIPLDQLDLHVPLSAIVTSTALKVLGEHSKVEDEGTDSLLRLAGTRVRHDSWFRREYGWREGGIDGAHQ